jgi:hypothetical protein
MAIKTYTLIGQTPVPKPDLRMHWFAQADRRFAYSRLPWCDVSTRFETGRSVSDNPTYHSQLASQCRRPINE